MLVKDMSIIIKVIALLKGRWKILHDLNTCIHKPFRLLSLQEEIKKKDGFRVFGLSHLLRKILKSIQRQDEVFNVNTKQACLMEDGIYPLALLRRVPEDHTLIIKPSTILSS
ncbi:hypothetical protein Fmac_024154 [Flemingia macrophylla]|uniref:Uncharacterized protein n=1 Tax=Flemingia macrophylla TaxID=520843 RepID=A0ABD1LNL1_9FABA